jgi:copper chaperone NosL
MWQSKTLMLVLAVALAACSPEPVPIDYGKDECANCKMRIVQPKYGSEIVTRKGKAYKFDAPECMIAFLLEGKTVAEQEVALTLVPDFETEKFITVETAFFLRSDNLKSPMGLNVAAFATKEAAEGRQRDLKGDMLTWQMFKDLVKKEWLSDTTEAD